MTEIKNKKRLAVLAVVFALVLTAGVAYAALNGVLIFSGNVSLNPDVQVKIASATASGEASTVTIAENGQSATISIAFAEVTDTETITFALENVGNTTAKLSAPTLVSEGPGVGGVLDVTGTYTALADQTIAAGATIEDETMIFAFKAEEQENVDPDTAYTFTIQIDYAQDDAA